MMLDATVLQMARSKALDPRMLAHVRKYLRRMLERDFDNNQTKASKKLGLSQSQISAVLNATKGVGVGVLIAIADHEGLTLDELVGRRSPSRRRWVEQEDVYPERGDALRRMRGAIAPEVAEYIESIRFAEGSRLSTMRWVEQIVRAQQDFEMGIGPFSPHRKPDPEAEALARQADLEGIADWAYRTCHFDPEAPASTLRLASALLGPHSVVFMPGKVVGSLARLERVTGGWRILVARGLPLSRALHVVGHELGHLLIRRLGLRVYDEEEAADYLGAALTVPRRAFMGAIRAMGLDFVGLARRFATTQTCVALRAGEVLGIPVAAITPKRVRVRGPESWVWPPAEQLRREPPAELRRVDLTDAPERWALVAA